MTIYELKYDADSAYGAKPVGYKIVGAILLVNWFEKIP
jgi:hypothetical protein